MDDLSSVHRLDPRAKLAGLFAVTVVAVSAPWSAWPVYVGCAMLLAGAATAARVGPGALWRRGRVVLVPVLLVAATIPLVREDGLRTFGEVAAKAAIGITAAALLTCTTSFPSTLRGLQALRLPRLLVLIAALLYRYLFVAGAEVSRMHLAARARGYRPRHLLHAGPVGRLAAALFLRSLARGERVHAAMVARGFDAARPLPVLRPLAFGRADAAFVALVLACLLPLRVLA